jgi:GNAT superfamily N-acetyltransferase
MRCSITSHDMLASASGRRYVHAAVNDAPDECAPLAGVTAAEAESLARWFMDTDEAAAFAGVYATNPDLTLVCRDSGETIVGMCFGTVDGERASLQVISVAREYAGQGRGTRLLQRFEQSCRQLGCASISLGSSPEPYVERFYIKNGYKPVAYYLELPQQPPAERLQGLEFLRLRRDGEIVKLKFRTDTYDPAAKERIRQRFEAGAVSYIFEKALQP